MSAEQEFLKIIDNSCPQCKQSFILLFPDIVSILPDARQPMYCPTKTCKFYGKTKFDIWAIVNGQDKT